MKREAKGERDEGGRKMMGRQREERGEKKGGEKRENERQYKKTCEFSPFNLFNYIIA